jgi:hypothetical protein
MSGRLGAVTVDLVGLLPSWELHLRAERTSPETVKSYGDGVRRFLAWADGGGRPAVLDRVSVTAFTADLLEAGAEPATARARQLGAAPVLDLAGRGGRGRRRPPARAPSTQARREGRRAADR